MASVTQTLRLRDRMSPTIRSVNGNLRNMQKETKRTSNAISAFGVAGGMVLSTLAMRVADLVASIPDIGDALINVNSRLSLITGEGKSVAQINEEIYNSAMRARGGYTDMANSVTKLGLLAGDAFSDTSEVIAFTETMKKAFRVGGSAAQEQRAAMYQLTQAMAAGKLQGDEFRSVWENAPMLADAIAKFTGKSKAELKDMSSKGLITSEIIKGALFSSADEIEQKFAEMAYTTSDGFTMIKNVATNTFSSMLSGISTFISNGLMVMANNFDLVIIVLGAIATIALGVAIPALWAMIPPALSIAAAFAVAHAPLLIIVGIVTGLLLLFLKFPKALGVVVGAARAAVTAFGNAIKAIGNGIIGIVNLAIKALNKLPGVDLSMVEGIAYDSVKEQYGKGKEIGTQLAEDMSKKIGGMRDKITGLTTTGAAGIDFEGFGDGKLKGGKLDSIGKIEDEVQISDENLKWLKDIATRKFQIQYQQMTPQVTANFGDINETADVNKVLGALEDKLVSLMDSNLGGDMA